MRAARRPSQKNLAIAHPACSDQLARSGTLGYWEARLRPTPSSSALLLIVVTEPRFAGYYRHRLRMVSSTVRRSLMPLGAPRPPGVPGPLTRLQKGLPRPRTQGVLLATV
jgi:hypothetical protein